MDGDSLLGPVFYNGSAYCAGCGAVCTPIEAMYSQPALCTNCKQDRAAKHVKNRMIS